jgi:hypothetical protein
MFQIPAISTSPHPQSGSHTQRGTDLQVMKVSILSGNVGISVQWRRDNSTGIATSYITMTKEMQQITSTSVKYPFENGKRSVKKICRELTSKNLHKMTTPTHKWNYARITILRIDYYITICAFYFNSRVHGRNVEGEKRLCFQNLNYNRGKRLLTKRNKSNFVIIVSTIHPVTISYIQSVPGRKVNILGGHSIGHSNQKNVYLDNV